MQFKEQKGRVQVLAYDGYDKEKRRAIVKMLGSFDRYTYSPSVGLLENLTDEQMMELQSEIEKDDSWTLERYNRTLLVIPTVGLNYTLI